MSPIRDQRQETAVTDLADFLLARIAERRARFTPGTVTISGGVPAPEVPNCVGPTGTGCPERWALPAESTSGWWRRPDVQALIREHELTHATPEQRFALAECEAKRRIVAAARGTAAKPVGTFWPPKVHMTGMADGLGVALRFLALPYADHPHYDPGWKP